MRSSLCQGTSTPSSSSWMPTEGMPDICRFLNIFANSVLRPRNLRLKVIKFTTQISCVKQRIIRYFGGCIWHLGWRIWGWVGQLDFGIYFLSRAQTPLPFTKVVLFWKCVEGGEWSVVSQRVGVTPQWIGDRQIKGTNTRPLHLQLSCAEHVHVHKYPTKFANTQKCTYILLKYPTTTCARTQISNQICTNTQPLHLRLSSSSYNVCNYAQMLN